MNGVAVPLGEVTVRLIWSPVQAASPFNLTRNVVGWVELLTELGATLDTAQVVPGVTSEAAKVVPTGIPLPLRSDTLNVNVVLLTTLVRVPAAPEVDNANTTC